MDFSTVLCIEVSSIFLSSFEELRSHVYKAHRMVEGSSK